MSDTKHKIIIAVDGFSSCGKSTFAKAIAAWKFAARDENMVWEGRIAGPDRLRFLGMISRYSALVGDISLTENSN